MSFGRHVFHFSYIIVIKNEILQNKKSNHEKKILKYKRNIEILTFFLDEEELYS